MPFDIYEFCSNPAYAGDIHVRLATSPIPDTGVLLLSSITEATFAGYRRAAGANIWAERSVSNGFQFALASKSLTWKSDDPAPQTVTGLFLVGILAGVERLLGYEAFNGARTVSNSTPGFTAYARHVGEDLSRQ